MHRRDDEDEGDGYEESDEDVPPIIDDTTDGTEI